MKEVIVNVVWFLIVFALWLMCLYYAAWAASLSVH